MAESDSSKKEMEVMKGVDLKRYMGRWYEIASFPSRFQPKDGVNTRATYTLNEDGATVHVLNETWSGGKRGYIEGSAYPTATKPNSRSNSMSRRSSPSSLSLAITGSYILMMTTPTPSLASPVGTTFGCCAGKHTWMKRSSTSWWRRRKKKGMM